jgi:hypothetical protein
MHIGILSAGILGVLSRGTEGCSENVYSKIPLDELAERVIQVSTERGDAIPAWTQKPTGDPDPDPADGGAGGDPGEGSGGSVPFGGQDRDRIGEGCSCFWGQARSSFPSPAALALLPSLVLVWLRRRTRRFL